jgi:2-oxoglutarate dehydrogenase E2 component (dihydrolipoamide succinyltransferase)
MASMKRGVKVILVPSLFSKSFFTLLRHITRLVTSASVKDINIGMATALPSGNLIVPVIKNADGFNLVGLSKKVNGLADAARNNKLKPEDISDGTFTLTNVGTFGSLMGTPIINQPQAAILAVGAIKKRPVVIETPHGDSIAIRHMMYLSMSYDHRIVDGSLGATFLTAVANELENFNANRDF